MATPSRARAWRSASAISGSTRKVVVSTKVRPFRACAQRAANAPTAAGCALSFGFGKAAGTHKRALRW